MQDPSHILLPRHLHTPQQRPYVVLDFQSPRGPVGTLTNAPRYTEVATQFSQGGAHMSHFRLLGEKKKKIVHLLNKQINNENEGTDLGIIREYLFGRRKQAGLDETCQR